MNNEFIERLKKIKIRRQESLKKYKILVGISTSILLLEVVYSLITVFINNNTIVIFMNNITGLPAYLSSIFITLIMLFPINIIAIIILLISTFKLNKKLYYIVILILGFLCLIFNIANAATLNIKNILHSIKDLWILFLVGILLICFSTVKLKNNTKNR